MVRSPVLFTTSLLLLASAATLAGVLVHDGEVGTDEARLAYADEGDAVKVKGTLVPFEQPDDVAWDEIANLFHHQTYELQLTQYDAVVLVTGLDENVEPSAVVVEGAITYNGPHPSADGHVLVVDADLVTEPFFDW